MKCWHWWALIPLVLITGAAIAGIAVLRSDWLREKIRARIIAEVNLASGGQVELGSVDIDWASLRARAVNFTLRGKESQDRAPFFTAARIEAGIAVRSWWERDVRLKSLLVEKPQVHIYVNPDGTTNLPEPRVKKEQADPMAELLRLKIGRLDVRDGVFEYDTKALNFAVLADGLDVILGYTPSTPRYNVDLAARRVVLPGKVMPSLQLKAGLESNRVVIDKGTAQMGDSHVEFTGSIDDLKKPRIALSYHAAALMRDIPISPLHEGFAKASGTFLYDEREGLRLEGDLHAEQLGYASRDFQLQQVSVDSRFKLQPHRVRLTGARMQSPYGDWEGDATLEHWRAFQLEGTLTRLPLDKVQAIAIERPYPVNALVTGPMSFSGELTSAGLRKGAVEAKLTVAPLEGELPVEGQLNLSWSQECNCIDFGSSSLATESARLTFQGVLGRRLDVGFFATRLRDIEPVVALLSREEKFELPVSLSHGTARVHAVVTGELQSPVIEGQANATNLVYDDIQFESVSSRVLLNQSRLELKELSLRQDVAQVSGDLALDLHGWTPESSSGIQADLKVAHGDVSKLLALMRVKAPVTGSFEGAVSASGTVGTPNGRLHFVASNGTVGDEKLKRVTGEFALDQQGALKGNITLDQAKVDLTGDWTHPDGDFRNGVLKANTKLTAIQLREWETVQSLKRGLDATLNGEVRTEVAITGGTAQLKELDGELTAPSVHFGTRDLGQFRISGETHGEVLALKARLDLPQGPAEAGMNITLANDYATEGNLRLPRITFGMLHDLMADSAQDAGEAWPVRGFFEGSVTWRGPAADPKKISAQATINRLQVRPRQGEVLETQVDTSELTLRNNGPLAFEVSQQTLRVVSAKVTALNTDLSLSGSYAFGTRLPWNLEMKGNANLAVLGSFYKDLMASGSAEISASLRGAADDPQLSGRMNIADASFFLENLPNGIEHANGTVFFDKNRANIEKLSGKTGGGQFDITGFVAFSQEELNYRLQAAAENVRVRYPEGVSTTLDADLTLTGSSARSTLAGTVVVDRSGLIMGGDIANIVGNTGNPIPAAATQNDFLRNLQFDVRVRTSPDAVFVSNYTSDLQVEADMRLRGSPSKPVLLGSIKANQGIVTFFGNKYTITRGEVLFYNTAVIQPNIDLDLETRVRGITVYLNVSGPMSRLNVTYRSEPPLQSSEILALLTVGRTPAQATSSVATSDRIRSQTVMENSAAGNTLLGGALSAGLTSRTERFFGASRIRIDPSAIGVDNLPQARLSIEQSISRDITLTYITNLSRAQQQVVQIEWDLSRQWSVLATKDENGYFAVDFLYRKRFK